MADLEAIGPLTAGAGAWSLASPRSGKYLARRGGTQNATCIAIAAVVG